LRAVATAKQSAKGRACPAFILAAATTSAYMRLDTQGRFSHTAFT